MSESLPPTSHSSLAAKQQAQERHFIGRALERFELKLTPARYQHLIRKVEDTAPGTKFLYHSQPNKTVWIIRAGGQQMRVVYDHTTERLVTCLPLAEYRPRPESRINPHKLRRLRIEGRACR